MYSREVLDRFVNRPPVLLLCGLPVLKAFRVLQQRGSLSPTDPGSPCQSCKSKGVETEINYILNLQYSSQIVEIDTASLEFSRKFLSFTPHSFVLTLTLCPLPPPALF